jgi:LysR family transcriptional regulator, regulator for bpeEF and oprC
VDNRAIIEHDVPMRERHSIADLNQLRVFSEVARTLSVTAAARTLGMPKSTVSRDVARLERDLGALLLSRRGRRFVLTEAGALFADHAAQILARIKDAADAVATSAAVPNGTISVQTTYVIGYGVLMPLMPSLLERYPEVDVALDLANHGTPPAREWDVRLATGPLEDSSFAARKVAEMQLGLYASEDYIARRGRPGTIADLSDHDIVDKHWTRGASPWETLAGTTTRPPPVQPRLMLNDLLAVALALGQGAGIGWLPSFLAEKPSRMQALVPVMPELRCLPIPIHAVFPLRRAASPKIQAFVDFLAEAASDRRR